MTAIAWRQYRLERRMFWRNPTAAFFNFLLPLLFLAIFGAIFADDQENLNVIVPGIAGMAVMAPTFSALAFNLTFLREQGILKRLRGTPMPGWAYLAGIGGSVITNCVIQVAIITAAGKVFFNIDWPPLPLALLVFVAAGVVCFASLGIALSHAIPNFDSAAAYVNAIFLPMILVSGVFYDEENAPQLIADIARALPLTHLVDGMSGAMVSGEWQGSALLVLGLWALLGTFLALRGFRREG